MRTHPPAPGAPTGAGPGPGTPGAVEPDPPGPLQLRMILIAVSVALMAVIASVSGLNVVQTELAVEFGASQSTVLWIINIYTLTLAALLLPLGAIGERIGRKPMLVAGLTVFGAASVLAGLAPTAEIMLGARVLSGAGAAMIMPITLAVITSTFPEEERGRAIGGGRPARCAAVGRLPRCRGRPAGRHPRGRGGHRARGCRPRGRGARQRGTAPPGAPGRRPAVLRRRLAAGRVGGGRRDGRAPPSRTPPWPEEPGPGGARPGPRAGGQSRDDSSTDGSASASGSCC